MTRFLKNVLFALGLLAAPSALAVGLLAPDVGTLNFPFVPPPLAGGPGSIDNMAIGGTTAASGTFSVLHLDTGTKTATAVGTSTATATLNKSAGVITSAALTTAAGGQWVLTLTDSSVTAADQVFASVGNGTNTTGTPAIATITAGAGSVVITVQNIHASAALNGTIEVNFAVLKN